MRYKEFSINEFANDSFFLRWVRNPDDESDWFWTSFIEENPECKSNIERAREIVLSFQFAKHALPDEEFNSMRNTLLMTLQAEKEAEKDSKSVGMGYTAGRRYWPFRLAAAIIVIPVLGFVYYLLMNSKDLLPQEGVLLQSLMEKRANPSGQKSVLFLSDGTKIWLNSDSKISYASDFTDLGSRDVYLEGEAFFDVAHDGDKPFVVHTSSIKIKVLGTSFNVKSYREEETIETTLVEGKIRIEQTNEKGNRIGDVELKPNQCAVFAKESKIINIEQVVAMDHLSWKQERLVFNEETIDNVILQIERWYNVKIHIEGRGKLDCKLTATIENETLEEVLDLIEVSHNIQYRIKRNEVFIEGKLCNKR